MADNKQYDKARELAEEAMKKTVEGDDVGAEKLAKKAKATNSQAVEDVLNDLDEDADSEHDPDKINEKAGGNTAKR
jgi:histone H3/H4